MFYNISVNMFENTLNIELLTTAGTYYTNGP